MKIKSLLFSVALATALVSCGGGGGGMSLPTDNDYAVMTIAGQDAETQASYPASIKGVQDVEIRPMVSGFITKVMVKEGQRVSRGQVLFTIDNTTYAAAVNQAQAAVNTAKAQLSTAKLTYDNNKQLFEKNVIGSYELESAKNSFASAEAALAQAQAALASAKQNLAYCTVTSPANGVVGNLPYKVGALVSPSIQTAFTTVSDINTMQVYFSVTEKELIALTQTNGGAQAAVASFPTVKLQLADGSIYNHPGKVSAISGVVDQSTGSVSVRVDFVNPDHILKSGASGSILIPNVSNGAIIVPMEAIADVQNKHFVYVVGKDNKVKYTEIKVADDNDGKNYTVTSGIKVGDRIVAKGISSLTEGQQINPLTLQQYQEKLKKTAEMGKDQSDLDALKKDFGA